VTNRAANTGMNTTETYTTVLLQCSSVYDIICCVVYYSVDHRFYYCIYVATRRRSRVSMGRNFQRNMTKFAPHQALKSIALFKLTFDARVELHRVVFYSVEGCKTYTHSRTPVASSGRLPFGNAHRQSTFDAVYVYAVPWLWLLIVPFYPHCPHSTE